MALATVDSLILPLTLPQLRGAADAIVRQQARLAAASLLRQAPLWQAEISINAVEDQAEYTLDVSGVSANAFASDILKLSDADGAEISPWHYTFDGYTLSFRGSHVPTENKTAAWLAQVHIVPNPACTEFPQHVLKEYSGAIAGRVFEALAGQRGKPWYSPELAAQGYREFRRGVGEARRRLFGELNIRG